jgi:hypothetical protein
MNDIGENAPRGKDGYARGVNNEEEFRHRTGAKPSSSRLDGASPSIQDAKRAASLRPFHELYGHSEGPDRKTGTKEGKCQAEGCPVKTTTIPLPAASTEISLDIGSPTFRLLTIEQV